MNQLKSVGVSALWISGTLCAVAPVWAQSGLAAAATAPAPGSELQEVTVSSSRINIAGYQAPTPVTAVGLQDLQAAARPDIADVINRLPQFGPGGGPNISQNNITNGTEGLDVVNLRNLGIVRTLVLLDGQRVVPSNITGGTDLSTVPQALVERIDVVTGGASAAWGSDAVAGVVNLIINKNFNGVRVNLTDSDNWKNQHPVRKVELAAGTGFADNRGHVEVGATWLSQPKPFFSDWAEGFAYQRLMPNPVCPTGYVTHSCAGGPIWVEGSYVGQLKATPGGLITGTYNAAGKLTHTQSTGGPLINTYFEGPTAQPLVFDPGVTSGGAWQYLGTRNTITGDFQLDSFPISQTNALFLGSFDVTDNFKVSLQYDYGYGHDMSDSYTDDHFGNLEIYSGNPYIPASVQSTMDANGMSAIQVGTTNTNPVSGNNGDLGSLVNAVGIPVAVEDRELNRFVVSFDGRLGSSWNWNAYAEHSEVYTHIFTLNIVNEHAFANSIDAVTVGSYTPHYTAATYPNPRGIPLGSVTCLTNLLPVGDPRATSDCAPLNLFGTGPGIASQAAIDYIHHDANAGLDSHEQTLTENAAEASLRGTLPFGLPAGPVAAAVGVDYRREKGVDVSTYEAGVLKEFEFGDFPFFWGQYDTKEAFAEINVPVLRDQGLKSLSFDAAYRGTDYSTSGFVSTYKFGVVGDLTDWLRLRGSYSYDIRAPQMDELFNQGTPVGSNFFDFRNQISVTGFSTAKGNPNLKPEDAETRTLGLVFNPMPGLNASVDWWYIRINGLIARPGSSLIQTQCAAGNATFCQFIEFNGPIGPLGFPELSAVLGIPGNLNWETESGIDFSLDYRIPFGAGALGFNITGTDVWEGRQNNLGTISDCAGSAGVGAQPCGISGLPKFNANVRETWTQGPWLVGMEQRVRGAWLRNSTWVEGVDIDDNTIPAYVYFDVRGSYQINDYFQVFAAIDNTLDKKPPVIVSNTQSGTSLFESPFRNSLYDTFGRVYRVGVRAKF